MAKKRTSDNPWSIMADRIDRHPLTRELSKQEREQVIDRAVDLWRGRVDDGRAIELAISEVVDGRV